MLLSIALILLVGMCMSWICQKIKLPGLLGMLATGVVLGPYVLNLLDGSILGISSELRKIALIIILTRAGLGLDLSGLKKIGRSAVMMCFVPASFELLGMLLLAPKLMGISLLEAAIMGAVLAAVSPAVVVPRMVKMMEEGYGVKEGIPQLILAGASVDDVYVMILLVGMCMSWICQKIKLPGLLGMLATGVVLGPYVLNLLDGSILGISSELRKIALIIILTRAGLGLDLSGLKKIGRSAVMMCFVPASFELLGMLLLAPKLMGISLLEAAIMGAVLAAVSPAVVVPRMVKMMEEGYGVKEGIPQLILAGASVDDVYVIVLFSTFVGMMQGKGASVISFVNIPVSIILGIIIGLITGTLLGYFFKRVHIRDTSKVLIILSISFLLVTIEDRLTTAITFSALIAIMFIGIGLQRKRETVAKRISIKYGKLWVGAEVFLFVLVGATVNIGYLGKVGIKAVLLIAGALLFRMLGVFVCLLGTSLGGKEKVFVMMAYTPKATVQAAIGGIPLSLGFACGDMVLTVAVLAIVLTAPLGAFAIDLSYKKLLNKR